MVINVPDYTIDQLIRKLFLSTTCIAPPSWSTMLKVRLEILRPSAHFLVSDVMDISAPITESMLQKHYDDFYEEVFYEIESKYGEIEEMNVCENLGDHIVGNVYIKFYK